MRITQFRHLTDDELLRLADVKANTDLEIELTKRLSRKLSTEYEAQLNRQMELVFGETGK